MPPRASELTPKSNSRAVNTLLHTLRGEHFRRSQNAQGSRSHVSSSFVHNSPTLPVRLEHLSLDDYYRPPKVTSPDLSSRTYSGPKPPKSWTKSTDSEDDVRSTSFWRRQALSLILYLSDSDEGFVPPLTTLCLRILASYPSPEFVGDIVPWIPLHLRRELIRDAAINAPLDDTRLYALYADESHAAGEIIVAGPWASLPEDYFLGMTATSVHGMESVVEDWDAENSTPEPLATLALVSTTLHTSTFLSLPPSLTKLALINLALPIPLHRLPSTCPLLIILDLSYNSWLEDEQSADAWLQRMEWKAWSDLQVLGLRGCIVPESMLQKVNKGRWDDVEIIQ